MQFQTNCLSMLAIKNRLLDCSWISSLVAMILCVTILCIILSSCGTCSGQLEWNSVWKNCCCTGKPLYLQQNAYLSVMENLRGVNLFFLFFIY
jgi:hypothetical protein